MKLRSIGCALLCGAAASILLPTALGHGGTYRGPGDTVPAGGSNQGGGGATPGPTGGNPSGGSTGNPTGGVPTGPGGKSGGPGNRAAGGSTGGETGTDLTNWEFWWNFNKDQFLGLRSALYAGTRTGEFFDGDGTRNTLVPTAADIRGKVVPALKHALETERQNDIVTGALVALAKIGDVRGEDGRSEFGALFQRWLPDRNQEISETSAVALGILSDESLVRALADLAADDDAGRKLVGQAGVTTRTRAFALYGLGLVGARAASNSVRTQIVDELAAALQSPGTGSRELGVAAVISIGLTPLDWSAEDDAGRQAGASRSRAGEIEFLQSVLATESNDAFVRAHVPGALAHLLTKERELPPAGVQLRERVVRELTRRIGEHARDREETRQSCILALGQLADLDEDPADADARAELRRMAEHGLIQERAYALIALGQVAGRPGSGTGSAKSLNLVRGLLVDKLGGASAGLRPWAALGLGVCERGVEDLGSSEYVTSPDVKRELRSALRGAGQETAGAFAIALGIARDREAEELLRERLKSISDAGPRGYVALGLGMIGASAARPEIQRIVRDSKYQPELLRQAAIALGLLGDKELVPELLTMLSESKSLASQAAVASALGFIGDARSIDPLVAMLRNRELSGTARGFAAVALGIVADKEALPWNAKVSINLNYRASTSTLTSTGGTGLLDIL